MNTEIELEIERRLDLLKDLDYREFNSRLIPQIDKSTMIGVRTPALRALAAELSKRPEAADYLDSLPHRYYEQNNLHGLIIERLRGGDTVVKAINEFLPFVDNWATCDMFTPSAFKNELPLLLCNIKRWIASGETYTIRFGLRMLMCFFLGEQFKSEYLDLAAGVKSDEYYVNMMLAWFFATALAKQYEPAVALLERGALPAWVHNKTIQKAVESLRIPESQKLYLRGLRVKI